MNDPEFYDLDPFSQMIKDVENGDICFLKRRGCTVAAVVPLPVYEELRSMSQRMALLYEPTALEPEPEKPIGVVVGEAAADIITYLENVSGKGRWTSEDYRRIYLLSPHWRARRAQFIRDHGADCVACGKTSTSNDVHHLSYERMGGELDEDLEVRCRACHDEEHAH